MISGSFALGTFALLFFLGKEAHAVGEAAATAAGAASDTSIFADAGTSILKMLAEALLWIARLCISMTVFALEFFIQLAKYNGYIDAPIVILGWTMIRDIANMFFVVVLLIIAFGTILGLEQYEWKKTMVNFIMAAIFINFSKMIAGLIIDVAHVFTMTFVNAIAATAGGNLINMFHLNSMVSIVTGGLGGEVNSNIIFEIFAGALMALIFAVLAMATMGAYLVVMVSRIVVLWALIILSPLAYILSVIPQTKSYADTWWSEFGKHVVVAPIMVFFLWLGFATLGTGSFVQSDLGINFGTTDTETAKALGLSEQSTAHPKVSISEVSTWENMANFILAIAFLWIGIEQVQKTGVRGGELLSDAKSFATKAAMIGSGYAIGRWLTGEAYDRGKEGAIGSAKYLGNRIPLVGGAALTEYGSGIKSTFDRKGVLGIAGAAVAGATLGKFAPQWSGLGGMESKIKRSEYAKANEDKGPGGWLKARIWEPAERAEKRAEDWKTASERMSKTLEESYSTSGSRAGQVKLDETVRMQATLGMAEAKGKQKVEGRNREVSEITKMFDKMEKDRFKALPGSATMTKDQEKVAKEKIREDLLGDDSAMSTLRENYLDSIADPGERKKLAKFIDRDGGVRSRVAVGRDVLAKKKTKAESTADAEESAMILNRGGEIAQAKERDNILIRKGMTPKYMEDVLARHQKEDMDLMGSSNYDRTKQKVIQLRDSIRNATDPQQKARYQRDMATLAAANASRGAVFSENLSNDALAADASGRSFSYDYEGADSAASVAAQQARELSVILQEQVGTTQPEIDGALKKIQKDVYGDDKNAYLAFMRSFTDGLMHSAADGAVNKAGLFKEDFDATTGDSIFRAVDYTNSNDKGWSEAKREFALSQAKSGRVEGFEGTIDRKGGKYVIESDSAMDRVAHIWGNITTNVVSSVDKQNIDTFNSAFDAMIAADRTQAIKDIQKMVDKMRAKATDERGIRALLKRTNLFSMIGPGEINILKRGGTPEDILKD